MEQTINAGMLKACFLAGAKELQSKQDWINELNVFPVPDGDTGTNMTLTLLNAVKELSLLDDDAELAQVCKAMSQGTLRGARGNSGVILSQLVRGFAKETEGETELDQKCIANAFDRAVKTAYKAVMKPKEGTILTVSRAAADKAMELQNEGLPMDEYFREILQYAEEILKRTPDMLPVLKEAGVVDSGGQGLVEFLRGAKDVFSGKEVDLSFSSVNVKAAAPRPSSGIDTSNIETSDIKFGYCTEFIINMDHEFTDEEDEQFKAFLTARGDSIVCVSMDEIVKVHVHTNHPGEVIEKALTYGYLSNMKIDNMRIEHNEKVIRESDRALAAAAKKDVTETFNAPLRKEVGFVAVCSGEGLAQIFKGMSVDEVIEGGQTMNPSTDDILEAISRIYADNIFILPNNKNIIMAAEQAASLCEDKNVIVIPTRNVCQGINAVINYIPALSIEDNTVQLTDAAKEIKTAEITHSIRDTEIDGCVICKGDYMGIGDDGLLATGPDLKEVTLRTAKAMMDEDSELVTIYYGADGTEEDAAEVAALLEEEFEDADYEVTSGGQPVYYYIVSVE